MSTEPGRWTPGEAGVAQHGLSLASAATTRLQRSPSPWTPGDAGSTYVGGQIYLPLQRSRENAASRRGGGLGGVAALLLTTHRERDVRRRRCRPARRPP